MKYNILIIPNRKTKIKSVTISSKFILLFLILFILSFLTILLLVYYKAKITTAEYENNLLKDSEIQEQFNYLNQTENNLKTILKYIEGQKLRIKELI